MEDFKKSGFCKIGLQGPKPVDATELYGQMAALMKKE